MTPAQHSTARKAAVVTIPAAVIIALIGAVNQRQDTDQKRDYVSIPAFVKESTHVAAREDAIYQLLSDLRIQQATNGERLREICEKVRAGCR